MLSQTFSVGFKLGEAAGHCSMVTTWCWSNHHGCMQRSVALQYPAGEGMSVVIMADFNNSSFKISQHFTEEIFKTKQGEIIPNGLFLPIQ